MHVFDFIYRYSFIQVCSKDSLCLLPCFPLKLAYNLWNTLKHDKKDWIIKVKDQLLYLIIIITTIR